MDGQPGWSFNARRKSMQGGAPNHRRSLSIGNNVVSVDDLYKVRVCCCSCFDAAAATATGFRQCSQLL
jgi:hypothetical protein